MARERHVHLDRRCKHATSVTPALRAKGPGVESRAPLRWREMGEREDRLGARVAAAVQVIVRQTLNLEDR